jgi:uncharacterized protein (TIGR01777 family)
MKVVLAGGSGALGRRIAADLSSRGDEVVVLTRRPDKNAPHREVDWDGATAGPWVRELSGAVVVNLAGEIVDRRPTPDSVQLLTSSRVGPTRALALATSGLNTPPITWLQSSTLAIYGDGGDQVLDETAPVADGPPQMAGVARAWEAAAHNLCAERVVIMRTGVVFARDTPALDRLAGVTRWGLGGRIANGRQWVSWLHIADFLSVVRELIDTPTLSGVVHVTSPNPVRNGDLMAALRKVLHRPPAPPTPAFVVRFGSVFLRTDPALALLGRRCVPTRLLDAGFDFQHPNIAEALTDLLRRP